MAAFKVLQAFFVFSTITLVFSQQPIISRDVIEAGESFNIICDASRVADLDPNVNDLKKLRLLRKTALDTNFELLAQYETDYWKNGRTTFPNGRDWNGYFTGLNDGINNRRIMKIDVQVHDARCQDSGMYMCEVTYNNASGVLETMSTTQTVSSKLGVTGLTLHINKYRSMTNIGGLRYAEYWKGDDATLTCTFKGEEEYKIQWKQAKVVGSSVLNIMNYPNDKDITTSDPTYSTSYGLCDEYAHKSVLNLGTLSQANDHVMYLCIVKENGQSNATEEARDTLTMALPSGGGIIIGGSIASCILVIIAVVVVI